MTQTYINTLIKKHEHYAKENCNGWEKMKVSLKGKDLENIDFSDANLLGIDFQNANLYGANFQDANLTWADFKGANLYRADFGGANLKYADFRGANINEANFYGANLQDVMFDDKEKFRFGIILKEQLIGYKKSSEGKIITLEIPKGAIVFSVNDDDGCRTNKAKVIDMENEKELSSYHNCYNNGKSFKYHLGDEIEIDDFDMRYNVFMTTGIYFYKTKDEAIENFEN